MENLTEFREFLRNLLPIRKGFALLLCGSSAELPLQYAIINATDVDIMYTPTDICALPVNVSTPDNFQGTCKTLIVSTEGTHPGFARLCLPDCKRPTHWQASIVKNHYRHNPAWTTAINSSTHTDIINSMFRNIDSSQYRGLYRRLLEMKVDRVFAICCPCWPKDRRMENPRKT